MAGGCQLGTKLGEVELVDIAAFSSNKELEIKSKLIKLHHAKIYTICETLLLTW